MFLLQVIINVLFTMVVVHQVLYWVYLWQLKEYRLDRFRAGLRTREDWIKTFLESYDLTRWFRPKLTIRSLVSVLAGVLVSLPPIFMTDIILKAGSILLNPLSTALSLAIVAPMFWIWKNETIKRASYKMRHFKGKVIGVTGSYGKSMTKEMLTRVLSIKYQVLGTPKNTNSEIGIALTVLNELKGDEDFFVVEMGAYKKGEIARSCQIVQPDFGIITGIGDQHLDLFGSRQAIREAKFELIDSLEDRKNGLVAEEDFSLTDAKDIKMFRDHVEFVFEGQKFTVPLLGKNLVRNVIAVIKMAGKLGLSLTNIADGAAKLDPKRVYPRLVTGKEGLIIIVNSYNSSLESFLSAIDYLDVWDGFYKVVVTPGMIELGENSREDHRRVGVELAKVDEVLVTKASYFSELNMSGKAKLVTDYTRLKRDLNRLAGKKTVILFQNRVPMEAIDAVKHDQLID